MEKMAKANKLYDYFKDKYCKKCPPLQGMPCHDCFIQELAFKLEETEVDAVPVVHGHWINVDTDTRGYSSEYECSACNCIIGFSYYSPDCGYAHCPHCGAKMDSKEGEQDGILHLL